MKYVARPLMQRECKDEEKKVPRTIPKSNEELLFLKKGVWEINQEYMQMQQYPTS